MSKRRFIGLLLLIVVNVLVYDAFTSQNISKLRMILFETPKPDIPRKFNRSTNQLEPSSRFTLRGINAQRRVEATIDDMLLFLKTHPAEENDKNALVRMEEYTRDLKDELETLKKETEFDRWTLKRSKELGDLVQRRFDYIQNPIDCSKAKKVLCRKMVDGFGSEQQYMSSCLIFAYSTQRTLILDMSKGEFSKKGWTSAFEPISKTCTSVGNETVVEWTKNLKDLDSYQVIEIPKQSIQSSGLPFLKNGVPADLANEIAVINGNPFAWWHGQIMKYLFKPTAELMSYVNESSKNMGFQNHIVGVHVRRTDKIAEAKYYHLDEYMKHVEDYFKQRSPPLEVKRVFLMTDEPLVYQEASKYSDYKFISDEKNVKVYGQRKTRYTDEALRLIIRDIYLLSQCDFIVCTMSSNVCKSAYAMMQTDRGDTYNRVRSLDEVYRLYHYVLTDVIAVNSHKAKERKNVLSIHVGDRIQLLQNYWNGTSRGHNMRTRTSGQFPSDKTAPLVNAIPMPTYPEVI